MKVLCTSLASLPASIPKDVKIFTFFERSDNPDVGGIGNGWVRQLERAGFAPSIATWDFVLFAFAVCAADFAILRKRTADAWTREIELEITLNDAMRWNQQATKLEHMLRTLTGDFWRLRFTDGGPPPPAGNRVLCDRDCVALLSGGLDSLVGGIDAIAQGKRPIFVSQLAHEDTEKQVAYASMLGGRVWHQQWSHGINFKGPKEPSTRGRSMGFYGLAILSASLLPVRQAEVIVPENGFISVNPPLLPGRMASLSTRTTHPLFMQQLQAALPLLGVDVRLTMPYQFKTKGEMLVECADQNTLAQYASSTTSCGRYRTYNRTHCGRCVPCMVRKAAFLRWNPRLDKTVYRYVSLANSGKTSADDPMAAALAVLTARSGGIDKLLGATLSFAQPTERAIYRRMLEAGLDELATLLERDGLL
ncbi:Qat anti-phage system QueC-like protein QatC [Undibacterium curvum]|uniref:Qat anti-phage system QueC-like protein QatC n=1 Tax=Undibacterium curvum TaxID=2762294 RepID=UPI003D12E711